MIQVNLSRSGDEVRVIVEVDYAKFEDLIEKIQDIEYTLAHVTRTLGEEAKAMWISNAETQLKSSKNYVAAVEKGEQYPYNDDPNSYMIQPQFKTTVDGKDLGVLLEHGYEPFDMKERFLKGANQKVVHFEHGTPGTGHQMELPNNIYNVALKHNMFAQYSLTAKREPALFGKVMGGLQRGYLNPSTYADANNPRKVKNYTILAGNRISPTKSSMSVNYAWKSRQFAGLKSNPGRPGTFSTFRTISQKSPPDSWINPGQVPKNIFKNMVEGMLPRIKSEYEKALAEFL
jgi:hypothetical protein